MSKKEMTGKVFGRVKVIGYAGLDKGGTALWECRCECGKVFITRGQSLRSGHTKSCGCYHSDIVAQMATTHGLHNTRLYNIWAGMKDRCKNIKSKEYDKYGGRGILVCDEWTDFSMFHEWANANGYNDDLTIDRIDNNKGYFPENCRWVTRSEQNRNTSRTHRIMKDGVEITSAQAARLIGMNRGVVAAWYRDGKVKTFQDVVERRMKVLEKRGGTKQC